LLLKSKSIKFCAGQIKFIKKKTASMCLSGGRYVIICLNINLW
jgi:hypothetical protein